MDPNEYQVTIKSANHKVDDYTIKCQSQWTVARMKQQISLTHVNKPGILDQRIIYAGNLLKDDQTLEQIFFRDSLCTETTNSNRNNFTIHLVCRTNPQKSDNNTGNPRASLQSTSPSTNTSTSASSRAPTTTTTNATNNSSTSSSENNHATSSNFNNNRLNADQRPPTLPNNINNRGNIFSTTFQLGPTPIQVDASHQAAVQNLMQSDQMRQQIAVFQQLAYIVAAQMANNLASSGLNLNANIGVTQLGPANQYNMTLNPTAANGALNLENLTQTLNNPFASTTSQIIYGDENRQTATNNLPQLATPSSPDALPPRPDQVPATSNQAEQMDPRNSMNNPAQVVGGPDVQVAAVAQVQQPQQVPAPFEQVAPAAAAPQQDVDAHGMQHDWIDWVYYSIRVGILMAALYMHTSPYRIIFILCSCCLAYYFNRRSANRAQVQQRLLLQQQRQQQLLLQQVQQEAAQLLEAHAAEAPGDNGALRRRIVGARDSENPGNADNLDEGRQQPVPAAATPSANHRVEAVPIVEGRARLPFFKFCYLLITDFLASLVPE